jgi:3-oxoadipate enol-lactonase
MMSFAEVNGVKLYYELHGEGEPVLLIPGLGSDAATWGTFLEQHRYRFIVLENRGSSRSSKPVGPYSTEIMASDAAALLAHLGISRAHVIGKSMGGMIAQWVAVRYPERIHSLVLASSVLKHDAYGEELLELAEIVARKAGLFQTYRQAFLLSYSREYCENYRERLKEAEALINQMGSDEMIVGYLGQCAACRSHDSTEIARRIQCPTMVIVGKNDLITPASQSSEIAAAIPNSQLVIHPHGGHGFWREFASEVDPIVADFLSQHPI